MLKLEEIQGFQSPGELDRFMAFIASQISIGQIEEISPDPNYHSGEIYGGRWFRNMEDGSVWRLISPDPPFTGLFERVVRNEFTE